MQISASDFILSKLRCELIVALASFFKCLDPLFGDDACRCVLHPFRNATVDVEAVSHEIVTLFNSCNGVFSLFEYKPDDVHGTPNSALN